MSDTELIEQIARLGVSIDQSHPGCTLIRAPLYGPLRGLVYEVQVQGPKDYSNALRRGVAYVADLHPPKSDA